MKKNQKFLIGVAVSTLFVATAWADRNDVATTQATPAVAPITTQAAATPSPVETLDSTAQQVVVQLKAKKSHLTKEVVYDIVNQYLIPHVDVTGMSRSVLGRNAWNSATEEQKAAFTQEFTQLVVRTYSTPLTGYTDEVIRFAPIRGGYQGKKFVNVNSLIVRSQGNNIPLNYSLVLLNNEWKIYDMSVEGVSLLQSFRSQFAQELTQGNIDQLITNLKKHNQPTQ